MFLVFVLKVDVYFCYIFGVVIINAYGDYRPMLSNETCFAAVSVRMMSLAYYTIINFQIEMELFR